MADAILTINAGSSSIKFALFELRDGLTRIAEGEAENIGAAPHLRIKAGGVLAFERRWPDHAPLDHEDLLNEVLNWVEAHLGADNLIAAGHRIVHGGASFTAPLLLDPSHLAEIAKLSQLAPLHEPHNCAGVQALFNLRPGLKQIGCFDTSFHHTMPDVATRFALPEALHKEGVRRYGFHGLSYEYIVSRLPTQAPHLVKSRVIIAHLGNGASMCAVKNGKSIDSTMGFTALDGLVMGTRTGAIDAGVLLYLMQSHNMDEAALTDLLYKKSGLLGLSGISGDVRLLLADGSPAAKLALDVFAYQAAKQAAGLVVALGGLDGLIFTAGIGEHAAPIRTAICAHLSWLGLELSPEANDANEPAISTPESAIEVRIIPTDEELMIARHTLSLLSLAQPVG
ncbi:acetate/propionate family kinase [Acidocella facilis]|uniref:acetate/propionate family kinase n=1 Tax=Acidocella facilis TaxID=525 RepID=UPI001EED9AE7|nr:acetate/propionate family kinase [Acidocella facilis]